MTAMQAFNKTVEEFGVKIDSQTIYSEAQREFLLKPFKLTKFSIRKLVINYVELTKKYHNEQLERWNDEWHKNQRKLFIQFLICFCKLHNTSPENITSMQWDQLSEIFFGKSPMFLKFQGLSIMKNTKKISWDENDDDLIRSNVRTYGQRNWNQISKGVFFSTKCSKYFSAKQIRERWFNHISENINRGQWSLKEDFAILEHVANRNRHWCEIVKLLENTRTQHMIKNRYKFLTRVPYSAKPSKQYRIVSQALSKIRKKLRALTNSRKSQVDIHKYTKIPVNSANTDLIDQQQRLTQIKLKEDPNELQAPSREPIGTPPREGQGQGEFYPSPCQISIMGIFLPFEMLNGFFPPSTATQVPIHNYGLGTPMFVSPVAQTPSPLVFGQENTNNLELNWWQGNSTSLNCLQHMGVGQPVFQFR